MNAASEESSTRFTTIDNNLQSGLVCANSTDKWLASRTSVLMCTTGVVAFSEPVPANRPVASPLMKVFQLFVISDGASSSPFPPPHARCAPPLSSVLVFRWMRRFSTHFFFSVSFFAFVLCTDSFHTGDFGGKKKDQ